MPTRGLMAAWAVVALFVIVLAVASSFVQPASGPSLDEIIRANLAPHHDRISLG
ncbi:MAG TPA: hypothetical protein VI113_02920 [Alphaproteobacteria bacterium]